ncbi:class I glutamine amidotransferase-like protein [Lepidopterella palustris CBS 459.81]|uniref:Class I glutamine amidotransferase-like protein n=1 Tax=Lepidopterella palustris CBS 459.81 TaxID=1314670 RepID=A0A8E2JHV5_9PEZI|nr:class I glutamine amidotransferase-like protein [Lepidopterella palustris CBS 459.81]
MTTQIPTTKTLHIGVLILPPIQLLDASPIDLFSMLTPSYLTACQLPAAIISLGVPITITYIAPSGANTIALCTANAGLQINAGLSDPTVAPGVLDILLIPGPDPAAVPEEAELEFVRKHVRAGVELMTVCTGVFVAGYAGVLDGKRATGPRAIIPAHLKKKFPKVKWEEKRWVVDGKVWTSAGITNGQDMVAAYIRQRWPGPLAEVVCAMADVGQRGVEYENLAMSENAWWVWQIFRAWVRGSGKAK